MEEDKIYLKVLKNSRIHNGLKYTKGYNEVKNFVETGSCVPGRIYFCDPSDKSQNICRYLHYGDILVDIILPINDPDFKMIIDPSGGKSASNKIIIDRERNLSDPKTFEYMASCGVDITKNYVLKWAIDKNYWDVVFYLVTIIPLTSSRLGLIEYVLTTLSNRFDSMSSKIYDYNAKSIKSLYEEYDPMIIGIAKLYDGLNNAENGAEKYAIIIASIKLLLINYRKIINNAPFKKYCPP
ncbi:putative ankyrin repeat protein [Powai lake megavirus]|uniref:Putative ankyrin repeat protein n=1 Tax=Powai lake megavirus TaxID=1842663 RepID=A0A160ERB7_9VIRU|nr:putative ankyrin repeat protein [Powai lake megavirus]ANB51056.1 putative ankyrin repeat protein [Powai lake megavirus]